MDDLYAQSLALAVLALIGICTMALIAKNTRWLSFRVLVIATYTGTNLLSGIAHLLNYDESWSYFNAVRGLDPNQLDWTIFLAGIGLLALCLGTLIGLPDKPLAPRIAAPLLGFDRAMIPILLLIITPISVLSFWRVRQYAENLGLLGQRIISTEGGFARYAYLTNWGVWVVSLFVIWYSYANPKDRKAALTLALAAGGVAMVALLSWSGGRSSAVLMFVPVVMVLLPRLRLRRPVLLASLATATLLYSLQIQAITSERTALSRKSSGPVQWLDWEWGRFSMLGFAVQHNESHGPLQGETITNSVSLVLDGLSRLLGSGATGIDSRSAMQVAGQDILHSYEAIHVVPGLVSEMYLNFGLAGVVSAMLVLGIFCGWIDRRFEGSQTAVIQLFWAYLGTIFSISLIGLDTGYLLNILWTGAPLIVAAGLSYLSYQQLPSNSDPPAIRERVGAG